MSNYKTISVISRKDEELLRLNQRVLDESPDLVAVVGTDNIYYYVNPAYVAAHGMSADQLVGHHITDFIGEEAFEKIVSPNLERCIKGEDVRYEEWFNLPNKGALFMDVRYLPLNNEDNEVNRIVIMLRDITYRIKAEEIKLKQEKLRTIVELAGTYNHEINNPLCALRGYIEIILQNEGNERNKGFLEKACHECERINDVTKKLAETTTLDTVDYPGGSTIIDLHTDGAS